MQMAGLLGELEQKYGWKQAELIEEMQILLSDDISLYEDITSKKKVLQNYVMQCRHNISGKKVQIAMHDLAENLEA